MHDAVLGSGHAGQFQAARPDRLDMLGPGIDQRDVMAEPRQMAADLAADRAGADERDDR